MDESRARAGLAWAARRLDELGLNHNASGNLSVRVGADLLVTPSGIPADRLDPADMVRLDLDGAPNNPDSRAPTSEWRLHTALAARRPEAGAIVHTHSVEATAAATLGMALPALHYVVARFGTNGLRCAPYATYGSAELADAVTDTLGDDATACLMANHGAIALAPDLDDAVALALDVEWFCSVVRRARAHGDPIVLDDDELTRVATRLRTYGQPPP
ncbi:MAG: class II aldolase/adducin family protein [Actinomycetota bacterium]|nr:class II aldolase/adducin family protein [Actinomycetota bacterium]